MIFPVAMTFFAAVVDMALPLIEYSELVGNPKVAGAGERVTLAIPVKRIWNRSDVKFRFGSERL